MKRFLPLINRIVSLLLILAAAGALFQLAARYPVQWDVTQNALNSLEPGSVDALALLEGPVKITVYATEQDAQLGDIRKLIREFVALYQRYKHDISLNFVDPVKDAEAMRKASIRNNGEMVVEFEGRSEHITTLNEQTLSSALLRLAHSKDQLLMYLGGHGERKLEGAANHDLGEFGKRLKQLGYRLSSLNLTIAPEVPANTSMLVLSHPQTRLMPGEVKKLLRYIDNGGNLLWLVDAEPLRGLEPLAEKLGITIMPGIVIDPAAQDMNAPLNWTLGAGYPPHAITRNFDLITVFPDARALSAEQDDTWEAHTLVEGAARGWVSENRNSKRFNKNRDIPGPVDLALALLRSVNDREQRIIVVGSGAFLANVYSGNGGNLDLGINMVNWLADEERLITVQPHAAKDARITLSKHQLSAISVSFLVLLPLLLLAVGTLQWWRRKHQGDA
ncbi:MAG: GldG family protein [Gammaproteobacteria bacterium]|nr:GldG family protein [Gammaproteobacteria bacterium]MBU1481894.1 GldG family protein [Gammaproteobacteria bacterium]